MQVGWELAGRYRLEALLGRGGMGEVWRGVDLRLRRPVAVKSLRLTAAADEAGVARFRREAEIAATLNHPGITTVFDIDEHHHDSERLLFLVMELMQGQDLSVALAGHPSGMPIEQVTDLAVQIVEALAVAHEQGVVHRDIKPANLFLVTGGRVKICDFGIARLADATKITATGGMSGTPLYMSPEQIQGQTPDRRTDLYAFGCVLYQMLTGTTWVDAGAEKGVGAILYQHLNEPPRPPRAIRPQVPGHLSTLVLDLLAKQPEDRPQDASTVADRLRPVTSEPPQGRQNPSVRAAVADTPGKTATGTAPRRPSRPVAPREQTAAPRGQTTVGHAGPPPTRVSTPWPTTPPQADRRRINRRTLLLGGLGATAVAGISAMVMLPDSGKHHSGSGPKHSSGPVSKQSPNPVQLPGGGRIISVAFSPNGKTLAAASDACYAEFWDVATGRGIATIPRRGYDSPTSVAFSPNGKILATGVYDQTARLWDVATHRSIATLNGHTDGVTAVAFSPDGKTLATASIDHTARLWDVATHHSIATLTGHTGSVNAVAFSPDGKTLATGSGDHTARLWDVATHHHIATLTGHTDNLGALAFSRGGKTLVTGSGDHTARLWDVATRRTTATFTHSDTVEAVAFSPDGKTLATGSSDHTACVWEVATQHCIATFTHSDTVEAVAFSPDGKTLATGCFDYKARLWKVQ
ncbi:protein kinase [Actinoallomurus sp. NPDC050550]|uniref:WD40 repeat domain-containing serine/threonine protein kinase n=1 Tax=Actinoallomurus sp. NPDC050550 TaxID=3154937 RepID=UPI003403BEE6